MPYLNVDVYRVEALFPYQVTSTINRVSIPHGTVDCFNVAIAPHNVYEPLVDRVGTWEYLVIDFGKASDALLAMDLTGLTIELSDISLINTCESDDFFRPLGRQKKLAGLQRQAVTTGT